MDPEATSVESLWARGSQRVSWLAGQERNPNSTRAGADLGGGERGGGREAAHLPRTKGTPFENPSTHYTPVSRHRCKILRTHHL